MIGSCLSVLTGFNAFWYACTKLRGSRASRASASDNCAVYTLPFEEESFVIVIKAAAETNASTPLKQQ
jgi:hypothetical protein